MDIKVLFKRSIVPKIILIDDVDMAKDCSMDTTKMKRSLDDTII